MRSRIDIEKCGTCDFWTGDREPIVDKNKQHKIRIDDSFGNCEKEGSRFCGQKREQKQKCKYYSQWTELY